jgi:hypothetical protein
MALTDHFRCKRKQDLCQGWHSVHAARCRTLAASPHLHLHLPCICSLQYGNYYLPLSLPSPQCWRKNDSSPGVNRGLMSKVLEYQSQTGFCSEDVPYIKSGSIRTCSSRSRNCAATSLEPDINCADQIADLTWSRGSRATSLPLCWWSIALYL